MASDLSKGADVALEQIALLRQQLEVANTAAQEHAADVEGPLAATTELERKLSAQAAEIEEVEERYRQLTDDSAAQMEVNDQETRRMGDAATAAQALASELDAALVGARQGAAAASEQLRVTDARLAELEPALEASQAARGEMEQRVLAAEVAVVTASEERGLVSQQLQSAQDRLMEAASREAQLDQQLAEARELHQVGHPFWGLGYIVLPMVYAHTHISDTVSDRRPTSSTHTCN